MSLDDKRLGAAFFLPRDGDADARSVQQLLEAAGASAVASGPDPGDVSGFVDCRWAGLTCKGYLEETPLQRILCIFFFQTVFFELDDQGCQALVDAFRAACLALKPELALLAAQLYQADIDVFRRIGHLVLEADVNRLADERYAILYVGEHLLRYWASTPQRDDRDVLPVDSGRLVFHGRGVHRLL